MHWARGLGDAGAGGQLEVVGRDRSEGAAGQQVADATLAALGAESMQAIALQYQIAERTGADVTVEELLGERTVAELAASLPGDPVPAAGEVVGA